MILSFALFGDALELGIVDVSMPESLEHELPLELFKAGRLTFVSLVLGTGADLGGSALSFFFSTFALAS